MPALTKPTNSRPCSLEFLRGDESGPFVPPRSLHRMYQCLFLRLARLDQFCVCGLAIYKTLNQSMPCEMNTWQRHGRTLVIFGDNDRGLHALDLCCRLVKQQMRTNPNGA